MTSKQFLIIIIATLITVLIWFAVDIYRSRSQVKVSPEVQQLLEPVNPNFDQNLINEL